jgi:prepilin-type processing-associated H-X9-DG protein
MLLPGLSRAREAARRASCASNLKQTGLALKIYASEANGAFPVLQDFVGDDCNEPNERVLMFRGRSMYPEYLPDAEVLVCPSDVDGSDQFEAGRWNRPDGADGTRVGGSINPCLLDNLSYVYFPWTLRGEWLIDGALNDLSPAFVEAVEAVLADNTARNADDWSFTHENGDTYRLLRLKEGIERFLIEDINDPSRTSVSSSRLPVLFDIVSFNVVSFNHVPGGANILFMDGHAEFEKYPSREFFPATRAWAELMDRLEAAG